MVTIGTNYTIVKTVNVALTLGGSDLAKGSQIEFLDGDEIQKDPLIGTDYPDQSTVNFGGMVRLSFIYSTDVNLASITDPDSNGQVPITTVTAAFTDSQETAKTDTWTLYVRFNKKRIWSQGPLGNAWVQLTGEMTQRPGRVQTP